MRTGKRVFSFLLTLAMCVSMLPAPALAADERGGVRGAAQISRPRTVDGVSTWDCVWFGNYWQEDTNGDGHCYAETDAKQPIKWRVLDIDASGNALLLSDKLIDVVQYNETYTSVTWETCTLRSYLNSYGTTANAQGKNYSDTGFLTNAFSAAERNAIKTTDVVNSDNPVYGTEGGNDTRDKIFCLSLGEAMTARYGFVKNTFTNGGSTPYYTDADPTRVAKTTRFTADKPGYGTNSAGSPDWWWLRWPGRYDDYAASVGYDGGVYAGGYDVLSWGVCVRPAFQMNLSSSSSLWKYAGTVCSDGTVNETGPQRTGIESVTITGKDVEASIYCAEEDAVAYCAAYRADGRLLGVWSRALAAGENTFRCTLREGAATVKVFVVDPATFAPLCEAWSGKA